MQLEKRPDFEKVLARFEAWWHCEIIDRPPVSIGVRPTREARVPQKTHATLRERWFDFDYAMDCLEARLAVTDYVGDAFPVWEPRLGPELVGALFGCELEFGENTSWSVPVAKNVRDILRMKPDFQNHYWRSAREAMARSLERGKGRWITAVPDLHTNGDLLASLRDPENLCYDCADDLEGVRLACDHVTEFFPAIYEDLWKPVAAAGQPSTTWCTTLHAGPSYTTSCDFICMISPKMFRQAILPSLAREMRYLERNIFHLDGPNALQHLDALLALDDLNGIQWIYGAGHGPATEWIDVYKRIQAAGKCLQIVCSELDEARTVAENLRPEGVWITLGSFPRAEAEAFLAWVEKWSSSP